MYAYKDYIKTAIDALDDAIGLALSTLPKDIQNKHFIACRHAPDASAAWDNVRWQYSVKKEVSEDVEQALDALVMMSRAVGCLRTILLEKPTHPPDLSLPKVRGPRGHCQ